MEYRNELKYIICYADYIVLRMRLNALMKRDSHVNEEGLYTVRSLYFDDLYNSAYNEKYMGISERQKYRIRIYNSSADVINLERKIKRDGYIHKQTTALHRQQVEEIVQGKYECLREYQDPLLNLLYYECRSKVMRPRVIVDYEREPFVMDAGEVRITFDQNIRVGVEGWDIFNDKMPMVELMEPGLLVMEVKYTTFLPSIIQQSLPQKATEHIAVSKYILGCDKTLYKRMADY